MTITNYAGIDYGHGKTNIDNETGIRYGIISVNSLVDWIYEEFEAVYTLCCPHCGNELLKDLSFSDKDNNGDGTFCCPHCQKIIEDGEQYGDEPDGWIYEKEGYQLEMNRSNKIVVTKSQFYTHAQFCSPCFPGGGHLENPCEEGPKTYCLGSEWFDEGNPEYPVFKVSEMI